MIELLKFFLVKENFNLYIDCVPEQTDPSVKFLITCLKEMLIQLDRDVSWEEYRSFVLAKAPNTNKKDKDALELLVLVLAKAEKADVSSDAALLILESLSKKKKAFDLAAKLIDYSEGKVDEESVIAKMQEFSKEEKKEEFEFVTTDLAELYNSAVKQKGLRWRLKCLNESLGSLRQGDFGFIFARPESGKTTFLASEVSQMMGQTDKDLIWVKYSPV